jgi:osmoprotectant transport system ATP-binding protein
MIQLDNVTKRYGTKIAVDGLSIKVNEGEVCVLIGPSGCGKTTTLRMINRLAEPSDGRILVNGRDTSTFRPEQLRRSIGYAIQSVGLFPHMTVAANIATAPQLLHWDKGRIMSRVEELLSLVGLDAAEYGPKYPNQLSGGQAQRVGVARALAADPPILLMDEPFGAVDPLTRERLQAQFVRIQQELRKTIILVTHDLDEAIRLADRIAIMESGKLAQYDTPELILSKPADRFVRDFVGTDRALKRLSRIRVETFVKPALSVSVNTGVKEALSVCGRSLWVWVTDEDQRLIGWAERASLSVALSVRDAMVGANWGEIAVTDTATLRETLSHMLGQGFKVIPVVDEAGRLLGEVALSDIEAATVETEA